jgi:hypothetical protein
MPQPISVAVCTPIVFKSIRQTFIQKQVDFFEYPKQGFQSVQEDACAPAVEVETEKDAPQEPQKTLFEKARAAIKKILPNYQLLVQFIGKFRRKTVFF